jgi:hypothetical protein
MIDVSALPPAYQQWYAAADGNGLMGGPKEWCFPSQETSKNLISNRKETGIIVGRGICFKNVYIRRRRPRPSSYLRASAWFGLLLCSPPHGCLYN